MEILVVRALEGKGGCPSLVGQLLTAAGVARSIAALRRGRREVGGPDRIAVLSPDGGGNGMRDRIVGLLALSGVIAALTADLSAMSKAETERIWLSFGLIAYSGMALLKARSASWALLASATWALLVNHLLNTGW